MLVILDHLTSRIKIIFTVCWGQLWRTEGEFLINDYHDFDSRIYNLDFSGSLYIFARWKSTYFFTTILSFLYTYRFINANLLRIGLWIDLYEPLILPWRRRNPLQVWLEDGGQGLESQMIIIILCFLTRSLSNRYWKLQNFTERKDTNSIIPFLMLLRSCKLYHFLSYQKLIYLHNYKDVCVSGLKEGGIFPYITPLG